MRAVWSWLLEMVDLDREVSAEEGARLLTAAGLEVEDMAPLAEPFTGVVVAEVTGSRPHPDSDHLTLVDVIDREGGTASQVVCGAPNVPPAGHRVLWAQPGSVLPGDFRITARKVRGVMSPGMLVSERELGLSEDHQGIIVLGPADPPVVLGGDAREALGLDDVVFEISAPANRPDVLGHVGIARELASLLGCRFVPVAPDLEPLTGEADATALVDISIADPTGCPRYVGRVIDGLTVGPSPRWLAQRLRAVGVRPLSNLIDVTNYVMFELGQPLHGFDFDRVAGARIHVRRATAGERMTTLDDIERVLEPDDLLICDGDGPVALAGVMGGASTEIGDGTRRVLLEAAAFEPTAIRRTARRLGLHSESSHRFERHVDANGSDLASARAAQLLAQLGGGRIARGLVDVYPAPSAPRPVSIRASRATALTGVEIDAAAVARTLERLHLEVTAVGDDAVDVLCPTHRPDLEREVDLIEEVLRLHGFEKVPATLPHTEAPPTRRSDPRPALARRILCGSGLSEAITFGFTSPTRIAAMRFPDGDVRGRPLALRNPMSVDQSVMRTSLLPNLLAAVARNVSFGVTDVALFEVGSVFLPGGEELPDEPTHIAGVLSGTIRGWLKPGEEISFFDAKGVVEVLLDGLLGSRAAEVEYRPSAEIPYLHPGVSAELRLADGTRIGEVGEIHPATRRGFDLAVACFGFEIDLAAMAPPEPSKMSAIPRYPSISRDISFFVSDAVPARRVAELIAASEQPLIAEVKVLEDYRDPDKVPAGKKGMLWSITYRSPERTLTDAEVEAVHEALVERLLDDLPAERR